MIGIRVSGRGNNVMKTDKFLFDSAMFNLQAVQIHQVTVPADPAVSGLYREKIISHKLGFVPLVVSFVLDNEGNWQRDKNRNVKWDDKNIFFSSVRSTNESCIVSFVFPLDIESNTYGENSTKFETFNKESIKFGISVKDKQKDETFSSSEKNLTISSIIRSILIPDTSATIPHNLKKIVTYIPVGRGKTEHKYFLIQQGTNDYIVSDDNNFYYLNLDPWESCEYVIFFVLGDVL